MTQQRKNILSHFKRHSREAFKVKKFTILLYLSARTAQSPSFLEAELENVTTESSKEVTGFHGKASSAMKDGREALR